jgi:hypothetical protein
VVLPSFWMPRPAPAPDAGTVAAFDELLDRSVRAGPARPIDYRLPAPKWQFLCHVADRGEFVLHGSGNPDIACFEPRQSNDIIAFGNRAAVYAAADGLWPMYFAILDRDRYRMSLTNSCIRVQRGRGPLGDPHYFFSINRDALERSPWRTGTVYLLPAAGFEREEPFGTGDTRFHTAQAASLAPVVPAAKLVVEPGDFPFLRRIRGHDPAVQAARIAADPDGFPWLDEQ